MITSCFGVYEVLNYRFAHGVTRNQAQISKVYSIESMASKETPKKLYKKQDFGASISRCRLCNCVADPKHSKNLFRKQSETTLRNAEIIFGGKLRQESSLPHQICTPCERRLKNAIEFKKVITDTQRALAENVRAKRLVELSPSVAKPPAKVRAAGTLRRRSIDFTLADETSTQIPVSEIFTYDIDLKFTLSMVH